VAPPSELTGTVNLPAIKQVVRVPCIDRATLPVRPGTTMPEPGADPSRKSAGAAADVDLLEQYADKLEASMVGCFVVKD